MPAPVSHRFAGLWIPIVTPFRDGKPDLPALRKLVQYLGAQGASGFVACGSTGEAAALDADEQLAVLDAVLDAAGPLRVIMGAGGYHLPKLQDWVRTLTRRPRPIAGLLVAAPYYVRPSQAGLVNWFRTLADSSDAPLIVYDIPYRTGAVIECETLLLLAEHPNIVGVKDCGGDPAKTLALIADGHLDVLCGEDLQFFATLSQGGTGAITASAHLHTARFAAVMNAIREGRLEQARSDWLQLVPLVQTLFAEPNPGPIKAWLARQGLMQEELRAPMTGITPALRERLLVLEQTLG